MTYISWAATVEPTTGHAVKEWTLTSTELLARSPIQASHAVPPITDYHSEQNSSHFTPKKPRSERQSNLPKVTQLMNGV